ncbi:hypothetical protein TREMEDRAFT_70200 [Tremella mesenterica DSM 1558]|uniref:uncharacterized protein n=1 Tax=Tremella mesenterica (strain ATCC 24925 / CBS 8224 / DSM 1558 / NBRC 9311 / NRRL Y-6157 / RJB 2259-6 / UBC 559-6) TaxID=578456 RepID=UPI00032D56F4|nr:uncharacterized protein TREMEDRAFT_70200 [Tremella mesenterica DSM 1558]EIW66274.1 hypothetical protein TREMEDRAFT_70200 [Tremella mesenterica DSM 1558]
MTGALDADDNVETYYLKPPTFSKKTKKEWKKSGRGMMAAVSPTGGEVAIWVTKKTGDDPNKPLSLSDPRITMPDRTVYFASHTSIPNPVVTLYTESYTLFTSLQRIVASSIRLPSIGVGAEAWDKKGNLIGIEGLMGPPAAETIGHMRRLGMMYVEELAKVREAEGLEIAVKSHFSAVFYVLQLAVILYLPPDGRGEGLLGEELLDWVNDVDPAPDNIQGQEIMQVKEPWSHPSFWPYIIRCILRGFHLPASSFLRTLSSHRHPPISKLGMLLSTHLSLFPRSHNTAAYPLDHQFLTAHRKWVGRFKAELAAFIGGRPKGQWLEETLPGGSVGETGKWSSNERDFRTVIELMEGKPDRVLEESADWREAVGAWGILVDVGLRRDDLPEVTDRILAKIPADSTVLDDNIQASLCSGDIVKALTSCHELDVWLAAHLSDIFDKLVMIPDDEERFDMSLRDYFLLEYTDLLQNNPKHLAFWRIIADYLSAAGDEGRCRLREFILHVSLDSDITPSQKPDSVSSIAPANQMDGMQVEEVDPVEEHLRKFAEIKEACVELKLEEEWRIISGILADRLMRKKEFGLAATMCLQAEDGGSLSRIAEIILDTYITDGEEEFLRLVDTLPPSLLNDAPLALKGLDDDYELNGGGLAVSVFASRLMFLAEFRDYLLFFGQGVRDQAASRLVGLLTSGIAPIRFWAVLLVEAIPLLEDSEILFTSNDTFELLRVLEEITSNSTYAPTEYLAQLGQLLLRLSSEIKLSGKMTTEMNGSLDNSKGMIKKTQGSEDGISLAIRKLEEARLALARNLARALVVGFDAPF